MLQLPTVKVRGTDKPVVLIQGGMGAGVSLAPLAGAVAREGGVGTVSAVAIDLMVEKRIGRKVSTREAIKLEVTEAKRLSGEDGIIAVNCMAMMHTYVDSVLGAVDGGVNLFLIGAGLPLTLPEIVGDAKVMLAPIVSSAKALRIICERWLKNYNRIPDAVVLEGPLAGGHLGYKLAEIDDPAFQLEALFPEVLAVAKTYGGFPVIVAGGIWDRLDIVRRVEAGAAGVQLGTRFLDTFESGASDDFKQTVVRSIASDIIVAGNPETPMSPSGMPFRILKTSPGWKEACQWKQTAQCELGYMLRKGADGQMTCPALTGDKCFCICNGLRDAVGTDPSKALYTVGKNASRVDKILSVKDLMDELKGIDF